MRINKYLAQATGMSRRAADTAIQQGRVLVNNDPVTAGQDVTADDTVHLDSVAVNPGQSSTTITLNKPVGFVVSRDGQGSKTIYDLLPKELHHLKPVGRLDKDSSGLILLTNDGGLANQLTHPRYEKNKIYQVRLDRNLQEADAEKIKSGVNVEDYVSRMDLQMLGNNRDWQVTLHQGRNRQIRRTFAALGYKVQKLHRIQFGEFKLTDDLKPGDFKRILQE